MIVFKQKEYTEGKKYKKHSEEDLARMSKGQRHKAIEEERETATENSRKIYRSRVGKGALAGAALGGGAGAIGGKRSALIGAGVGSLVGLTAGNVVGAKKVAREGHDPDKRAYDLARRIDRVARKHGQEDMYEHETKKSDLLKDVKSDTDTIKVLTLLPHL